MALRNKYLAKLFLSNKIWIVIGLVCAVTTSFAFALSADYIRQITDHIH